MDPTSRQIFDEDQLAYHTILAQVTTDVETAFLANNGTFRSAVATALESLQDALDEFKMTLN